MSFLIFVKKSLSRSILLLFIISTVLLSSPKNASAGAIVYDPGNFAPNWGTGFSTASLTIKEFGLDTAAWFLVNTIIQRITTQTVNWINSGFKGSPAYITEPGQFFLDVADREASRFLSESSLSQICQPFNAQVRIALVKNYLSDDSVSNNVCTLDILKNNYEQFTRDFSVGGWDGWFEITQNSQNNPYGSFELAQNSLAIQIGTQQNKYEEQLNWGRGFLSFEKCPDGKTAPDDSFAANGIMAGDCLVKTETVTPGSVIEKQLNESLSSGIKRLEIADEINEVIGALLSQLMNKAIGSVGGLFGTSRPDANGNIYTDDLKNERSSGYQDTSKYVNCTGTDTVDDNGNIISGNVDCDQNTPPQPPPPNLPSVDVTCVPDGRGGQRCTPTGSTGGGTGGTGGTGGQCTTYNPGNGAPNEFAVVQQVASQFSAELQNNACKPGGNNIFLDEVVNRLHAIDPRWGWNGKRGDVNNLSHDAIAYYYGPGTSVSVGDTRVYVIDIISSCDTTAGPSWTDVTDQTLAGGTTGAYVYPRTGGGSVTVGDLTDPGPSCVGGSTGGSTGGGTLPPGGTGGATIPLAPVITSVSPTSVTGGQTIVINGTNLQNTLNGAVNVQFFDFYGARNTVVGTANSSGTQVTVTVPTGMSGPSGYVRMDNGSGLISNSIALQIGTPLQTTAPINTWAPTLTTNGWWPRLSPDGRYVAYGNWGESWVTDMQTGQNYDFRNPADLAGISHRCIAGQWITPTKITFVCESSNLSGDNMYRYEVDLASATPAPIRTADDTSLVAGSQFVARDGHWASWIANASMRLAKDNQLVATGVGGTMDISGNLMVHSCTTANNSLCLRTGTSITRTYNAQVPVSQAAITDAYIIYGGYGPIRGITPTGVDTNLRLSTSYSEGGGKSAGIMNGSSAQVILVNGAYWVASSAWGAGGEYIFLRPWGSTNTIVVAAGAASLDVAVSGTNFVIAYNDARGILRVVTVPINSPRISIP